MMKVETIYESDNFVVVNKPYDMYINSDDEKETNTVTYHIASGDSHLSSSVVPLNFIQRLDYSTSGVLCIAKNKKHAALAGKLFEKRKTGKYYLAVVRGHVALEVADIEFEVGQDPVSNSSHKMVALTESTMGNCITPRSAHTRLLVLETGYYNNDPVTVVLLKPVTGRRHQLRVHCAAIGHILLGDYTYSGTMDNVPHRMFLHATRLVIPLESEPLDIQTHEPFFSDPQFSAVWKPDTLYHKYRTKEEFLKACHIVDKSYVLGVTYKHFRL